MIAIYIKADKEKRRPVGTILKLNQKEFEKRRDSGLVAEYTGKFPPKTGREGKVKIQLKDLK